MQGIDVQGIGLDRATLRWRPWTAWPAIAVTFGMVLAGRAPAPTAGSCRWVSGRGVAGSLRLHRSVGRDTRPRGGRAEHHRLVGGPPGHVAGSAGRRDGGRNLDRGRLCSHPCWVAAHRRPVPRRHVRVRPLPPLPLDRLAVPATRRSRVGNSLATTTALHWTWQTPLAMALPVLATLAIARLIATRLDDDAIVP